MSFSSLCSICPPVSPACLSLSLYPSLLSFSGHGSRSEIHPLMIINSLDSLAWALIQSSHSLLTGLLLIGRPRGRKEAAAAKLCSRQSFPGKLASVFERTIQDCSLKNRSTSPGKCTRQAFFFSLLLFFSFSLFPSASFHLSFDLPLDTLTLFLSFGSCWFRGC